MRSKAVMMGISIAAGVAAEGLAGAALWWFTSLPVQEVAALSLLVYVIAVCVAMAVLSRHVTIRVSVRRRYGRPQIYNLRDYPEWREKERKNG